MSNLQQSFFDYGVMPMNDAIELKASAERIKLRLKRTAEDIIEIGRELITAKEKCGHGNFERWLSVEFDMSKDSAQRFMNVAKTFGEKPHGAVFELNAKALYALAAPSMPEEVRNEVIERVENGENVSLKEIEELKKENALIRTEVKQAKASLDVSYRQQSELQSELTTANKKLANIEQEKTQAINQAIEKERENLNQSFKSSNELAQKLRDELADAKAEQRKLIKQHENEVNDKVQQLIIEKQNEIARLESRAKEEQLRIEELTKAKLELNKQVGAIAIHKEQIKEIKDALLVIKAGLEFSQETGFIPDEVRRDWDIVLAVHNELGREISNWVNNQKQLIEV